MIDREDYNKKLKSLLDDDTSVYEVLTKDPTQTYKARMLKFLRKWYREGTISENLYNKTYTTSEELPKFYCFPKIHKKGSSPQPDSVRNRQHHPQGCQRLPSTSLRY